jgi:hypothetical protein
MRQSILTRNGAHEEDNKQEEHSEEVEEHRGKKWNQENGNKEKNKS